MNNNNMYDRRCTDMSLITNKILKKTKIIHINVIE